MLFKKLIEAVQLSNIKTKQLTEEEIKAAENEIIFGGVVDDLDDVMKGIENSDLETKEEEEEEEANDIDTEIDNENEE